jgi:predicted 3-demethylubiquinone-9 3-methyltransferase (glyoxalase superfamily)
MWQIVPRELESLVFSSDETKADLATKAMLSMRKLDINVIRSAYNNK